MKCTLITIIFAICVSVSARAEDLESNERNNPLSEKEQDISNAKVQIIRVTIRLTIINYSNHAISPISLRAPNGTTAFQLLQLAARRNPCYRFKYKSFSFGRFITSICCVDQDPKAKLYWMIYINGKLSPVGVDLLKPKGGDRLTFKYQKAGKH